MSLRSMRSLSLVLVFSATAMACGSSTNAMLPPGSGGAGSDGGTNTGGDLGDGATNSGGNVGSGGTNSGGGMGMGTGGEPIPPVDEENPTAIEAARGMGKGFNLGQMFESTQHPTTLAAAKAKIDAYYARGFRNVRIPITWTEAIGGSLLVKDATTGEVDRAHARLLVISEVIDYALTQPGLYVVINAHHEKALKTEARSAVLERLWTDIADIYSARSHRLIFEILNEPHQDDDDSSAMAPADLRLMTGLAYDKIRAVDPKRIIVIGGNRWFAADEVPAVWTSLEEVGGGEDDYVMSTFHHYNPWTFCGDNQGTYDDPWTEAQLTSPMETMLNWANTVGGGMPVYIGEWGVGWQSVYATMDCNNIRQWYTSFSAESSSTRDMPTCGLGRWRLVQSFRPRYKHVRQ